jgi:hypothetical protein
MDPEHMEHWISRAEFLHWFNQFGLEMALSLVQLKFMYPQEARVRFAQALLLGYKIERA